MDNKLNNLCIRLIIIFDDESSTSSEYHTIFKMGRKFNIPIRNFYIRLNNIICFIK